jgi:hypothetical protein
LAPQVVELLRIELEHEVFWKPVRVALDGPDESFGLDTVERREVRIEHHPVPAKLKYRLFDAPHLNRESGLLVSWLKHVAMKIERQGRKSSEHVQWGYSGETL